MLLVFAVALVLVGLGVFGMCFNIIFRKDGKFPEYEVGSNQEMRKRGIKCVNEEERQLRRKEEAGRKNIKLNCNESCSDCGSSECR
jgi:hypothetical protein